MTSGPLRVASSTAAITSPQLAMGPQKWVVFHPCSGWRKAD
ncbi:MAG: hypothetical protein Q8P67_08535 [archaeon]|nr:hypothetical protein [archaeon]